MQSVQLSRGSLYDRESQALNSSLHTLGKMNDLGIFRASENERLCTYLIACKRFEHTLSLGT